VAVHQQHIAFAHRLLQGVQVVGEVLLVVAHGRVEELRHALRDPLAKYVTRSLEHLYSRPAVSETASMAAGIDTRRDEVASSPLGGAVLRGLLWLLLGTWIGSWLLFA